MCVIRKDCKLLFLSDMVTKKRCFTFLIMTTEIRQNIRYFNIRGIYAS